MTSQQDAVEAVTSTPHSPDRLRTQDWETADAVGSGETTIASLKPKRAIAFRPGAYDLDVPAYESFPSDSTSGDTDTFDLSYFPMDAAGVAETAVLYEGGEKAADGDYSVDFDANTLEYTGPETANDLHVWYFSAMQASVKIRKVAPNGTSEFLDRADVSLVNAQDTAEDPLEFEFDHALQPLVPAYWEAQVRVDAPYPVRWTVDAADGTARADSLLMDVPINRADRALPEFVSDVVGAVAGAR